MPRTKWQQFLASDLAVLLLIALIRVALHLFTNNNSGFHRDELNTIALARPGLGVRGVPAADALPDTRFTRPLWRVRRQRAALLGVGPGRRDRRDRADGARDGRAAPAQVLAALAVAISPVSIAMGTMMMYVSFDYLWWLLAAFFLVKLIWTEDPRWWLGVGAAIGLGAMTRYTIVIAVAAMSVGVLLTPARRYILSRWFLAGIGVAALICLPNFIWQAQHDFIALTFTRAIHQRDIEWGRTATFFVDQLYQSSHPFTIPLWIAGLYFYFLSPMGRRFRALGWTAAAAFALFYLSEGRGYYTAPTYPILCAGGTLTVQELAGRLKPRAARVAWSAIYTVLVVGGVLVLALDLPIAPAGSS